MTADLLFVFALEREARPFRRMRPQARVIITSIGGKRAAAAMHQAIQQYRPAGVIAAGFAGGLRTGLDVGKVLLIDRVIDPKHNLVLPTYPLTLINAPAGDGASITLLSVDRVAATTHAKQDLAGEYGADVVDMETASIATTCNAHQLPWAAIRAISDTVDTSFSPELTRLMDDGPIGPAAALRALARHPSLAPEFWRLARDTRLAARRLADTLTTL